jgi:hypothetical protein
LTVDDRKVDASKATLTGAPAKGSRVKVKGTMANGVLVAKEVEMENENEAEDAELHGAVSGFDAATKTCQVRNTTVTLDSKTVLAAPLAQDGSDLAGKVVAVKGKVTGSKVVATTITLDN